LKSGGAYLPIEPGYPEERLDYMLKDSSAILLLTEKEIFFSFPSVSSVSSVVKNSLPATGHWQLATSLAYIIYTSGSTGRPKGVAVEHSQVANFVFHMYNWYDRDVGVHDRCLGGTNIMFDVSVWEFFLPLTFGARLVLLRGQDRFDVFALAEVIGREQITLTYLPPALLPDVCEQLKTQRSRVSLNKMLVGVEPIRDEVLEGYMQLNPDMKIINGYGPTETTICASSYNYYSHPPEGEIVPIGVPLSNNQILLLDNADHIAPRGIAGEICISGDGVSRGYINNPELTAGKYSLHPYFKDKRMYRTGDIARLLPDGNLLFIGRRDNQLKIRGYRIELREIENRLLKHLEIREVVVLPKEDTNGDKYLAAYFVSDRELPDAELREHLLRDLPDYMIPSYFVRLEKIPLTPNGKIDRRALPEPDTYRSKLAGAYVAPEEELEIKIASIWDELLQLGEVGIYDDFFELGGNSLKIIQLKSRLTEELNKNIPVVVLFQHTTISSFVEYLKESEEEVMISDTFDRSEKFDRAKRTHKNIREKRKKRS
jgi:amino acid adenylation domain-containing protein